MADVEIGHEIRRGAVTADGQGEAVLGLGFMLMGENSHEVTRRLKTKMDEIKAQLPPGVTVETVYDRTELVDHVIETVQKNLFEGGLLVVAVLFLFLGNLRAGLIVALAIPLSMLFAFSGMLRFGIAASLLSLGAIDFGLVVDSSVVMVENCVRYLSHGIPPGRTKLDVVRDAAIEVRKPTMFGELIIMIVYLPILTLEGVEGKLFRPMALTVILALAGSMVLSLTLMPVLASFMLPHRMEEREPLLIRLIKRLYAPVLRFTIHHKLAVLGFAACVLLVAFGLIAPNLGSEFVPKLSEGSIVINVVRLAGTDLAESMRYNTQMERLTQGIPGRGRASLDADWKCRGGHRSDGYRAHGCLHYAQTTESVEARRDSGGTDRTYSALDARLAWTADRVDATDRNASERIDFWYSFGHRSQAVWRRLRRIGRQGGRDRTRAALDSWQRRYQRRAGHRPAGAASSGQAGRTRPIRRSG